MRKKPSKAVAKSGKAVIVRHASRTYNEVPNEETLKSIAAAEKYLKCGDRKVYKTVDAIMKALR